MKRTKLILILMFLATAFPKLACASLYYNYTQDYLYDSSTGLYWQIDLVSTSTFKPSGNGQLATGDQVVSLLTSVAGPMSGGYYSNPAAYSSNIANLASFFSSDLPASSNPPAPIPSTGLQGIGYFFGGAISDGPNQPGAVDAFDIAYSGTSLHSSDWVIGGGITADEYVPGQSPPDPYWFFCNNLNPATCQTQYPAYIVSTTPPAPVPLPAAGWLMWSAVPVLSLLVPRSRKDRVSRI
jgi:hypothetical protein